MEAFLLEVLNGRTWQRDRRTFWTRESAAAEAGRLIQRGKAVKVRVLPVEVGADAIELVPPEQEGGEA